MWHSASELIIQCCIIKIKPIKHATHCISPLTVKWACIGDVLDSRAVCCVFSYFPSFSALGYLMCFLGEIGQIYTCTQWESAYIYIYIYIYIHTCAYKTWCTKPDNLIFTVCQCLILAIMFACGRCWWLCWSQCYRWCSLRFMKAIWFHFVLFIALFGATHQQTIFQFHYL